MSSRSRDASPSQTGRKTPVTDPYSALLAQGLQHSTSLLPLASSHVHSVLGGAPMQTHAPKTSSSSHLALQPPPSQPTRHRGASASATAAAATGSSVSSTSSHSMPSSRQPSTDFGSIGAVSASAAGKKLAPSASGTLPSNFKILPEVPPQTNREDSFNSFNPSFPQPDAFSHLHAGTGPKSPPNLHQLPPDYDITHHGRQLSFTSMFNSNADLLARKAVGHIPAPGGSLLNPKKDGELELKLDTGLEVVGEGEGGGENDDEPAAERPKRTKEEKAARRAEKEARRARKEAKRLAKAQQAVEEERQRLEALALQTAQKESLHKEVEMAPPAQPPKLPLPVAEPVAEESGKKSASPPVPMLQPPLPTSSRPALIVTPPAPVKESHTPSPPPPLPPMPVLSPGTLATLRASIPHPQVALSPIPQASPSPKSSSPRLDQAALRQKVVDEIKSTEKVYVDALFDLIANYMEPIKKAANKMGITPKQISLIFSNIAVLAQFHSLFLSDMNKNEDIVQVFSSLSPYLKMYSQYLNGYEKSIATINSLRDNSKFQRLLEEKRDFLKGRSIMHFLIMPVQR